MNELIVNVYNTFKNAVEAMAEKHAEYEKYQEMEKSGKYTKETIEKEIRPNLREISREISEDGQKAVEDALRLCDDYQKKMYQADALNPEELTDDVKLLNAGITLNAKDINELLARNAGNATMEQIVLRYANEKSIDLGKNPPVFAGHNREIQAAEDLKGTARIYGRWIDKENAQQMLDKFFPNVGAQEE